MKSKVTRVNRLQWIKHKRGVWGGVIWLDNLTNFHLNIRWIVQESPINHRAEGSLPYQNAVIGENCRTNSQSGVCIEHYASLNLIYIYIYNSYIYNKNNIYIYIYITTIYIYIYNFLTSYHLLKIYDSLHK